MISWRSLIQFSRVVRQGFQVNAAKVSLLNPGSGLIGIQSFLRGDHSSYEESCHHPFPITTHECQEASKHSWNGPSIVTCGRKRKSSCVLKTDCVGSYVHRFQQTSVGGVLTKDDCPLEFFSRKLTKEQDKQRA